MAKMNKKDVDELIKSLRIVNEKLQEQKIKEMGSRDYVAARAKEEQQIANIKQFNNALEQEGVELTKKQKKELESIYGTEGEIGKKVKDTNRAYQIRLSLTRTITQQLSHGWKYLIESDKVIRQTSLSLGLSSTKADLMRQSFQQSARDVAHLGGTLEDIQAITTGYADETGRARVLTSQMINDIEEIAKGTGLSVSEATELGARFEYMGLDARRTNEYIQGVVDTTERMGINTTKVLKNINSNYKRLTTFSFKNGTKAFKEMAMSAESTRVSMDTAMNVAEATRNLESVIELGANLQVMGGEFAKMDPLAWLHMARNEPEKIQEQIGKMTTGLFTLRKNSEGIFEKFISPADRDRLTNVAKSLGISNEEMFEIAQRQTDMALMSRQLAGTGLSEKEKALVKGAAIFNSDSGKFQVKLGGHMRDISNLTKDQAKAFESEQTLLKDRAVAAQDFDTALKATIEEFKSVLLPMLNTINKVFEKARTWTSNITKLLGGGGETKAWVAFAGFTASVTLLKATFGLFRSGVDRLLGGISNGLFSKLGGAGKTVASTPSINATQTLAQDKAAMYAGKGAGMKGLGMGAGIGAAGLGIGGGIGLAAGGISLLAKAMSGLNKDQADALASIVSSMAWMTAAGGLFATTLVWIGKSAGVSAAGLAKATLPILGIGAAIGIATAGIGLMGMGMSQMMDSAMNAKGSLFELALGVSALSLSMLGLGSGIGFAGMLALGGILKTVSKHSEGVEKVGEAFKNINTFLSGSKDDFSAIESTVKTISGVGEKNSNPIKELIELLKTPLHVKFDEKEVIIRNNISLSVDGKEFTSDVIHVPTLMEMIHRHQTNSF